jgi:hypothetical protein
LLSSHSHNASPGQAVGPVGAFTTRAILAPEIYRESVAEVGPATAQLEAQVNPNYQTTAYTFQYATEESVLLEGNGTSVPGGAIPAGRIATGLSDHLASATIRGLLPNTRYFYRVVTEQRDGWRPGIAVRRALHHLERARR